MSGGLRGGDLMVKDDVVKFDFWLIHVSCSVCGENSMISLDIVPSLDSAFVLSSRFVVCSDCFESWNFVVFSRVLVCLSVDERLTDGVLFRVVFAS